MSLKATRLTLLLNQEFMMNSKKEMKFRLREIISFVKHLRIHYQLLLLSGTFLLGGVFSKGTDYSHFIIQYFNVHILLFGGLTVYNSYWDNDSGPIGGLKHPPKVEPWFHISSLIVQLIGLFIASISGYIFVISYFFSSF